MSGRIIVDAGWNGVLKRLDSEKAACDLPPEIVVAYKARMRYLQECEPICPRCGSKTEWTDWQFMIHDLCWRTVLACRECSARHFERLIAGTLDQVERAFY